MKQICMVVVGALLVVGAISCARTPNNTYALTWQEESPEISLYYHVRFTVPLEGRFAVEVVEVKEKECRTLMFGKLPNGQEVFLQVVTARPPEVNDEISELWNVLLYQRKKGAFGGRVQIALQHVAFYRDGHSHNITASTSGQLDKSPMILYSKGQEANMVQVRILQQPAEEPSSMIYRPER